ncbi:DMT family transporter ['Paenibacillus yunnanensis' Narsing Rao et al. 2020]|uniref:DMT family transporter n=1 Tax=Paenibacillus tengchongensis TaxID=2608684 RepID=UPI00124EE8D8|nr:multidrug efflux SMR transporter [Paenibacillus tengchongensis]
MNATSRAWLTIVGAAVFEVIWVIGLKHASTVPEWAVTIVAIIISFSALIWASGRLPAGTVYAVFVGLGTAGTVVSDMVWFGEPLRVLKLVLIAILLAGVIGLKLAGGHEAEAEEVKEVS